MMIPINNTSNTSTYCVSLLSYLLVARLRLESLSGCAKVGTLLDPQARRLIDRLIGSHWRGFKVRADLHEEC